jgi:hypothetical protein
VSFPLISSKERLQEDAPARSAEPSLNQKASKPRAQAENNEGGGDISERTVRPEQFNESLKKVIYYAGKAANSVV